MTVSEYLFKALKREGVSQCFCVAGGASAFLLETLQKSAMPYICNYHEQACAMSAEGYARITNSPALVLVTNGPGISNAITGIAGAYQASIPMIVIAGQCPTSQIVSASRANLRQFGVQELPIVDMMRSITKKAIVLDKSMDIQAEIDNALFEASHGRKGPVYIEVPLDIQSMSIDLAPKGFQKFVRMPNELEILLPFIEAHLRCSYRPLLVMGNGVHLSASEANIVALARQWNIPVVSTWATRDVWDYDDPLFMGCFGIMGERFSNFAVQKADLLIVMGASLAIANIGYKTDAFAPTAFKIMIDVDKEEIQKSSLNIPMSIQVPNLKVAIQRLSTLQCYEERYEWIQELTALKEKYPTYLPEYAQEKGFVNSYHFINELSSMLTEDFIVVTDMGTSFTGTMSSMHTNGKFRLFTSYALCAMGFGLPGAIGAYYGAKKKKSVICIAGDGGMQMNIQELQTVAHNQIPLKIFVLNNGGYSAITAMQNNLFKGNYVGATKESGVSAPSFSMVAGAYGILSCTIHNHKELRLWLPIIMSLTQPIICDILLDIDQVLCPKVQSSKDSKGGIISASLENMYPYLSAEEAASIMQNKREVL